MSSQYVGRKNGKTELYVDGRYRQLLRTTHFFPLFFFFSILRCKF